MLRSPPGQEIKSRFAGHPPSLAKRPNCFAREIPWRGNEYLYSVASTDRAAFGSTLIPGPIVAFTTMRLM